MSSTTQQQPHQHNNRPSHHNHHHLRGLHPTSLFNTPMDEVAANIDSSSSSSSSSSSNAEISKPNHPLQPSSSASSSSTAGKNFVPSTILLVEVVVAITIGTILICCIRKYHRRLLAQQHGRIQQMQGELADGRCRGSRKVAKY